MQITSLVTGGAGFIGSHVVNHLIEMEHRVIVLDDLSGGFVENIHPNAEFCKGSITDVFLVNGLFEAYQFDYVYHLAAYAAEGLSHFIRRFNYQNNLIGSVNLINAAVNFKVKRFVFTSSIAVYGTNELPLTETQYPHPEDPYGIAKYAVEMDLRNAHEMFGLNYTIFRPHNVYGSNQNINDKYRNVVGIFMKQIANNAPLTVFGDGEQSRAFSFINDVAPYIAESVHLKTAENEVFNIGGGIPSTVNQLTSAVMKAMDAKVEITHLEERNEVVHAYSSHEKFNKVFKPEKETSLEEGLLQMATWVKAWLQAPKRVTKSKFKNQGTQIPDIEIEKNLPNSWKNNR
ncbi:MAG: NAD-dependent epimerase/dehydratase family protein [Crocinitomix sp.]|nr:NAD-dependent epimerase/dehydratase family protein [Crocinitomix sp.]